MKRCEDCIHYVVCKTEEWFTEDFDNPECPYFFNTAVPKREVERLECLEREVRLLTENTITAKYPHCVLGSYYAVLTKSLEDYEKVISDISSESKDEVAREIFEEIERKVKASIVVHLEEINKGHIQDTPLYDRHSGIIFALRGMEDFIAELKKRYTEGNE